MRSVARVSVALCFLAACGKDYASNDDLPDGGADAGGLDSGPVDSSTSTPLDATADAIADAAIDGQAEAGPMACNMGAKFGPANKIDGLTKSGYTGISLTNDELTAVFAIEETGDVTRDLFIATRKSIDSAFAPPQALTALNTKGIDDAQPALSADGLTLTFVVAEEDDSGVVNLERLYQSKRASLAVLFPIATPITALGTADISGPSYGRDQTFYFSRFLGVSQRYDFFRAPIYSDGGFGPVEAQNSLNSPVFDIGISITGDGLTAYFGSNRSGTDPLSFISNEIWRATRAKPTDAWSNVSTVDELNSDDYDSPNWVSVDGCRVYFQSRRGGANIYLYMASKPPAP